MRWPTANRKWIVPVALIGGGLAVSGWQLEQYFRFERDAKDAMINRSRDITTTLGVVLRSQQRFGGIVNKDRLQPVLEALVSFEQLESISILSGTGDSVASAGKPNDLDPEIVRSGDANWGEHTLTIMNLMDLGSGGIEDGSQPPPALVLSGDETRSLRPPGPRRPPDPNTPNPPRPPEVATNSTPRPFLGKPPWMTKEQYESVIHKNGAHSLVITLSTDEMRQKMRSDLWLRSMVSLLALGGAVISTLAWRNGSKNAELQIRLIKAGEMNTHLKAMNFAAAGLAHETRNPLNLIRGHGQMISMRAEGSPELKEHASKIIEEADRVTVQLNEFINYSKPREAHLAPVELKRLVADVARTLLPDIEEKQIQLVQPETPCVIEADEQLLRQALFNVLLNASQAVAPGGQIKVQVTHDGPREAVLEVSDDGPGVPAAERENIFKPYVTMRPKGVGLGLAIVRQIAAAHRWEIACSANEPRGARFRFSRLRVVAPYA